MAYYKDLREYIKILDKNGKLVTLERNINKDTELMPLVRWQFRGLPDKDRKAFLFKNTTDVKGKSYNCEVLIGSHAASRDIYALAMACKQEEILDKWQYSIAHPIEPKIIASGPAQEEVHMDGALLEHGGLEEFAIPISTPGFDNAPYFSAGNWVSKDPETGIRNVGNYRAMVKGKAKLGCSSLPPQHLGMHRNKYKAKGAKTMPAAVFVGPTPNIGLVAVTKYPYGVDEYTIAGAIAGEPVQLIKCKTVDLEVPATAEIVFEGNISLDLMERDGPFGEYTGYMAVGRPKFIFNITCITHRKKPIWNAYISQFPPSESSMITGLGLEGIFYKFLKYDLDTPNLVGVGWHNESGGRQLCVLSLKNPSRSDVWKALQGASAFSPSQGKIIIAVDDDIDPKDMDSVCWALCYRMQPDKDVRSVPAKPTGLDPSIIPLDQRAEHREQINGSGLLIDATRKWKYPPLSLPKKEFMERAKQIWEEEKLPPLTPRIPWFGYSLGHWSEEYNDEAALALKGEHYQTSEKLAKQAVKG